MRTVSKTTVLKAAVLCDVTAIPAKIGPLRFRVTLDPGMSVQVAPSVEL